MKSQSFQKPFSALLLVILLSAVNIAQERLYVEFTPALNWGDIESTSTIGVGQHSITDKTTSFAWTAAINVPAGDMVGFKLSFSYLEQITDFDTDLPDVIKIVDGTCLASLRLRFYLE